MTFTEQLAKEIAEKHNLSKSHIAKWRFRNSIPARYFAEKPDALDVLNNEAIRKVLKSDKINIETISKMAEISRGMVEKFAHDNADFDKNAIITLKKALSEIKINTKKVISFLEKYPRAGAIAEKEVKNIIAARFFFVKNVCNDATAAAKINEWVRGRRNDFPDDVQNIFLTGLLVFTAEINV